VNRNIYSMTSRERQQLAIQTLPGTLDEALDDLRTDVVVQEALGDHILGRFIEAKEIEWDRYRTQVDKWEIDQYLMVF
jgi:glutamine synthetase